MGELEHADRREQERALEAPAEELDREVAFHRAAEDPRHDRAACEGTAVRRHRRLEPGAAGEVGERLGRHRGLRCRLELSRVGRHRGLAAARARQIDQRLAVAPRAAAAQIASLPFDSRRLTASRW
jgi:hypothetical protein